MRLRETVGQTVAHAARQDEHVVDARAGQLFEPVEHDVAGVGGPLPDDALAEGAGLTAEIHHVAVDAAHLEDQGADPAGLLGSLDAGELFDRRRRSSIR